MRSTDVARPSHERRPGRPELLSVDFGERPFTVAWELTRSCALACIHCRAQAQPKRHPAELTTEEARGVVDQLADLAPPVLVLTGGDPFMRPDLFEIAEYAVSRGLAVSVSPMATALVTYERLARLRDIGVRMVHVSLDGAEAATHDAFRGFWWTYERTLHTLNGLREAGLPAQVGTTVTRHNVHELPAIVDLLARQHVRMWSLFFLVPTGRGRAEDMVDVETAEQTWRWMAELEGTAPFAVRTTAAPQYRRTMLLAARERSGDAVRLMGAGYQLRESPSGLQTRGVNDGQGLPFHRPHREPVPLRLPAAQRRARSQPAHRQRLPTLAALPHPPGSFAPHGTVRGVPLRRPLRWLARPRVRRHRLLPGR